MTELWIGLALLGPGLILFGILIVLLVFKGRPPSKY